jgi:hypothetical protein
MGCGCSVAAHDNEFNRSVLGTNAYYFTSPAEIEALLTRHNEILNGKEQMKTENVRKIRELYSWQRIVSQYEEVMLK